MLPIAATAAELAPLRGALLRLLAEAPERFAALFDPLAWRRPIPLPDPSLRAPLLASGLVDELEGGLVGRHRIRHHGERLFVMELGSGTEYFQDLWPETDAMLAALALAPRGRLLDLGTGTGIVAVEAAARGHAVVATDLYPNAVELARFNHALNGAPGTIDFRVGHLFAPVADERFDLILTAPHYTRVNDQLRLEVLSAALGHLTPSGRAIVATFCEWEGEQGELAIVAALLAPLVEDGAAVTVEPIVSPLKRQWFALARSERPLPGLTSRHRFLITLRPSGGSLAVRRPGAADQLLQVHVPLTRLRLGAPVSPGGPDPLIAVVEEPADLHRLEELLTQLAGGLVHLGGALPAGLLDECRFGARSCVSRHDTTGAAGAILDTAGGVRPCTHGAVLGDRSDSLATLLARQRHLEAEAFARRGCGECSALSACSRCLFPHLLDEAAFCDFIRAHGSALPALRRLFELLRQLHGSGLAALPVSLKLRPTVPLLIARGRPYPSPSPSGLASLEAQVAGLRGAWAAASPWLVRHGERCWIFPASPLAAAVEVDRPTAEVAELLGDGATAVELLRYVRERYFDDRLLGVALQAIAGLVPPGAPR